jgi:hypothetical protein
MRSRMMCRAVGRTATGSLSGMLDDLAKPDGISPLGQLDARFPISYRDTVPTSLALVARFFAAVAERNQARIAELLHFPFAIFEGAEPEIVESRDQLLTNPPATLDLGGLAAGSYDLLDGIELHVYNAIGAGLSMASSRYDGTGQLVARCDGIYAVTNNDGRWGIELISTIHTPARATGVRYREAERAAIRRGREWMLGYTRRDQAMLNATRQLGRRANVSLSNPRVNAAGARRGDPMAGYRIAGVRSRLQVGETTPESLARSDAEFDRFADWAGGGVGEWAYTINLPEARVLHATVDKAHSLGGYVRYTADHRVISETRALGITTFRDGRWGSSGGIGVMMYQDRTNDLVT